MSMKPDFNNFADRAKKGEVNKEDILQRTQGLVEGVYSVKMPNGSWIHGLSWDAAKAHMINDNARILQTRRGPAKETSAARREALREGHRKLFESTGRGPVSGVQPGDKGKDKGPKPKTS